jgi:predicted transcriptional regulator
MQLDLATKQDLEAFKNELLQTLTKFLGTQEQEKEWLRSKEVRTMLNISNGTLQNLRVKKLLNPTKVQGVYYYRLSEIQALLNAGGEQ